MKKIIIFLSFPFYMSSLMAQCPTSVSDQTGGTGTQFLFAVSDCTGHIGTIATTDGGANYSGSCTTPNASYNYIGGAAPDPLPTTFNFGGAIGSCEYDGTGNLILPVEFTYFKAKKQTKAVLLEWETAFELNNKGFEIEKSSNGKRWKTIGFVEGANNSNEMLQYSFKDEELRFGKNYYRLKQLDLDGVFDYSDIVQIQITDVDGYNIEVFPNPIKEGLLGVKINIPFENKVQLQLFDFSGKMKLQQFASDEKTEIDVSALQAGIYTLVLFSDGQILHQKVLIH